MAGGEVGNAYFVEYWAILCLAFPLSSIILILGLQLSGWRGSEDFAEGIIRDNWLVVVLVQLISQILGLILVAALCKLPAPYTSERILIGSLRRYCQDSPGNGSLQRARRHRKSSFPKCLNTDTPIAFETNQVYFVGPPYCNTFANSRRSLGWCNIATSRHEHIGPTCASAILPK